MIYTALGDSITFGENASSFEKAYPQLAVATLNSRSRNGKVTGYVLARPGWSSYDLLNAAVRKGSGIISQSSVISVWVGGVDLLNTALVSLKNKQPLAITQSLNSYGRNLRSLLTHIQRESHARIICCTQYNPFPNSPLAVESIERLNRTTIEVAKSCDVNVAPVHNWFEGKQEYLIFGYRNGKIEDALSGSLPVHPNDQGHRVIASGLVPFLNQRK